MMLSRPGHEIRCSLPLDRGRESRRLSALRRRASDGPHHLYAVHSTGFVHGPYLLHLCTHSYGTYQADNSPRQRKFGRQIRYLFHPVLHRRWPCTLLRADFMVGGVTGRATEFCMSRGGVALLPNWPNARWIHTLWG